MRTNVVGVTFSNEDGSSRAQIIESMSETDQICLERDPYNQYDSNAVKVCVIKNGQKKQIGFLAKDIAADISPQMRRGTNYKATVVGCGSWNSRPYCEIDIEEETNTQSNSTTGGRSFARPSQISSSASSSVSSQNNQSRSASYATQPRVQSTGINASPTRPAVSTNTTSRSTASSSYTPSTNSKSSNNSGCMCVIAIIFAVASAVIFV